MLLQQAVITRADLAIWPRWFVGPESEWLWACLQFVVITLSLYGIYRQVRIQSHANMLHAMFELAAKWDSPRMIDARRQVCAAYGKDPADTSINQQEDRIATFFEEISFFLKKGAFTADAIWEQYSYYVEHYWPMLEPRVRAFRKDERDDTWFENFEDLYDKMQNIAKKRGVHVVKRDGVDMKKFARGELDVVEARQAERAAMTVSAQPAPPAQETPPDGRVAGRSSDAGD